MKTITLGTTLRPESATQSEVAGLLAQRLGASVRLLHVSEDARAPALLGTTEEHLLGPVRQTLDAEAARLHHQYAIPVTPHLAAGSPVDALTSVSELDPRALLLLGVPPKPSLHPLGSILERVARKSRVPVWALREPERLVEWLRGTRRLRLLVCVDIGKAARAALALAYRLHALGAVDMALVHVVDPVEVHSRLSLPPPCPEHTLDPTAEAGLLRALTAAALPPPDGAAPAPTQLLIGRGSPDAHVIGLVDRGEFDLVVVGQRKRSVMHQLWSGSVSRGVLRGSPVSVVCVPAPPDDAPPPAHAPHVIVVGVDLCGDADKHDAALAYAAKYALPGGVVHVVHVMPHTLGTAAYARAQHDQAHGHLMRLPADEIEARGATVERHLLVGHPPDLLPAFARRVAADLVIVGARSHSAVDRALVGSVALALIEDAPAPVLLIPSQPA